MKLNFQSLTPIPIPLLVGTSFQAGWHFGVLFAVLTAERFLLLCLLRKCAAEETGIVGFGDRSINSRTTTRAEKRPGATPP